MPRIFGNPFRRRRPRMFISIGGYPQTVEEILDDNMRFKRETIEALERFKEAGAWTGTRSERHTKFERLLWELSCIYGIRKPRLAFQPLGDSGNSRCSLSGNLIVLVRKYSVVTFLHEFAHALGKGERGATKWSVNLFKRVFPEKYDRLNHSGHMLIRR